MWIDDPDRALDQLPLAVMALDPRGHIARANPAALEAFGLDETAVGQGPLADIVEDDRFRRALTGPPGGITRLNYRMGSSLYHAEIRALAGGPPGSRLVTLRDVTGLAGYTQLRRNLVLEILYRIRTPLTTILSSLSMASSSSATLSEDDRRGILSMGRQEAERLTSFVGQLRELLLIETDALRDEVGPTELVALELVERVVEGFRPRFEGKGQSIRTRGLGQARPALADPEFLARALVQVLRNAHLHTPEGTSVVVTVEVAGDAVLITVADDGPGIAEEELARVTERFRQGSTRTRGEGLGLYLARHLLLVQNGALSVDSVPGRGTTVEIHLPLAVEHE